MSEDGWPPDTVVTVDGKVFRRVRINATDVCACGHVRDKHGNANAGCVVCPCAHFNWDDEDYDRSRRKETKP